MQYKYLFFTFFLFTFLTCNKKDDLLNNEFEIEKANGIIHSTIKDARDGQNYATIVIDTLEWMNENLNYDTEDSRSVCKDGEKGNCKELGRLYNSTGWPNVNQICPQGWTIPTTQQWGELTDLFRTGGNLKTNLEYAGFHFQYGGTAFDDNGTIEHFDTQHDDRGYQLLDGGSYFAYIFMDKDGDDLFPLSTDLNFFHSCRCVRTATSTDNPFFAQCSDGIMNGNETGIDCGGSDCVPCPPSMTDDRDGQLYKTVDLGNQTWMAENLNYAGAGICYDNLASNCEEYGRLYSFEEVTNQNICPSGWHIPSDEEFKILEAFLGMPTDQLDATGARGGFEEIGDKLKRQEDQQGGNVEPSGFNARLGGTERIEFQWKGILGQYYTNTTFMNPVSTQTNVWTRLIFGNEVTVSRNGLPLDDSQLSCRCIKD